jgi:hypothetical protein
MSTLEKNIIRQRELVTKVSTEVAALDDSNEVKGILQLLCEYIETSSKIQESLAHQQIDNQVQESGTSWPALLIGRPDPPSYQTRQ